MIRGNTSFLLADIAKFSPSLPTHNSGPNFLIDFTGKEEKKAHKKAGFEVPNDCSCGSQEKRRHGYEDGEAVRRAKLESGSRTPFLLSILTVASKEEEGSDRVTGVIVQVQLSWPRLVHSPLSLPSFVNGRDTGCIILTKEEKNEAGSTFLPFVCYDRIEGASVWQREPLPGYDMKHLGPLSQGNS